MLRHVTVGIAGGSMKQLALLSLYCAVAASVDFETYCKPAADPGPCRAWRPRWYYNVVTGQCDTFIYGGCKGNKNNYVAWIDCDTSCVQLQTAAEHEMVDVNAPCAGCAWTYEKPKSDDHQGPCRASITRYYYDNATRTCKEFTYGGCEGNSNNYETVEECKASCNPATEYEAKCLARAETGPCRAHATLWAYDAKLGECKTFTYGGCDGNENKYLTKEKCEETCKHLPAEPSNPVCYMPMETGICTGHFLRYYYDNDNEICSPFL
ncbi:hypothetical protein MTO96_037641, partial [Rhipicephalus appendiculatus]